MPRHYLGAHRGARVNSEGLKNRAGERLRAACFCFVRVQADYAAVTVDGEEAGKQMVRDVVKKRAGAMGINTF